MSTLAYRSLTNTQLSPRPPILHRVRETVRLWRRRASDRRQLAQLNEFDLHDMGISPVDVFHELSKPFWRG